MIRTDAFFDTQTNTVTYLVWDAVSLEAMVIDPVLDYEPHAARLETHSADAVLKAVANKELNLTWILDTHVHADHLSAGDYLRQKSGAKLGIGAHIAKVQSVFRPFFAVEENQANTHMFDGLFEDGDTIKLGHHDVKIMHTPGHTAACVTYLIADMAFVGDTLFMPDYGTARADFPGGDAATLYRSIQRILSLPETTRIMTGHDYCPDGRQEHIWESTVEAQKQNVHLVGETEVEYVEMRRKRDATLNAPRLILPALQVNIRGGKLMPPAADGHTYLTIPVNRL